MVVSSVQRFTKANPCLVCGGHKDLPQGKGQRCWGFISDDGLYVHCTRPEYAEGLEFRAESETYAHRLQGECKCGQTHGATPQVATNGHCKALVATYDYKDEDGHLLFQAVRYDPKGFAQRRPDGKGGWIWKINGTRKVLYRLQELIASSQEPVYIPEGEKDVDRLIEAGLTATCNPMGAGKWATEYNGYLQGRNVVIIPDNDKAGRDHAQTVANGLDGIAASVRVLELPGLPEKGDVSDWLDLGNSADDLLDLARACPVWEPTISDAPIGNIIASEIKTLSVRTAREIAQTAPETPDWLIQGYLAKGCITLMDGKAKSAGKTTLALAGIAAMLRDAPFLGFKTQKTKVVFLTEERPTTFRQVLERVGLLESDDLLVVFWSETARQFEWAEAIDEAVKLAHQENAGLLVVDTLAQWAGLKGDTENDSGAMLAAMKPLQEAAASDLAVLAHHHSRKSGGDVGDSGRGSGASTGAADIILSLQRPAGGEHVANRRELHALSRFDQTPAKLVIELKDGGYTCLGDSVAVAVNDAKGYLLERLPVTEDDALPESDLLSGDHGFKRTTLREALGDLHRIGKAGRIGGGKRNNPYRYYLS